MARDDLAALLASVTRRLIAAERPLLEARELTMWEYAVLSRLVAEPPESQLALATAIGYDKTRLIALLDGLEARGLVTREPDPADRRARLVRASASGRRRQAATQKDIRAMEAELLADVPEAERRVLRSTLERLAPPPGSG